MGSDPADATNGRVRGAPLLPRVTAALVLLITAVQVARVYADPSRATGWWVLALGLVASVFALVRVLGTRRDTSSRSR